MGGALSQAAKLILAALVTAVVGVAGYFLTQDPPPPPEVAAADLAAEPASDPAPKPAVEPAAPAPEPSPPAAAARFAPTLDVVRVEPDGSATVAGQAEVSAQVYLRVDDTDAVFATADGAGAYAALFSLTPSDAPRTLTVVAIGRDGVEVVGKDRVILAPVKAPVKAPVVAAAPEASPEASPAPAPDPSPEPAPAPDVLKQTDAGIVVTTAADIANVTVDTVTYDGDLIRIGGRGAGGAAVRLYLDDVDSASATIMADGTYNADLLGIAPGTYTLRADQLDSAGKVTSRYELDITKAARDVLAGAAPAPAVVQVAAGTTLWAIAKAQFGEGLMYIQVYEANKDKIRDPNLIYPGQVFELPKQP